MQLKNNLVDREKSFGRVSPIREAQHEQSKAQESSLRLKNSSSGAQLQSSSHFKVSENSMNSIY